MLFIPYLYHSLKYPNKIVYLTFYNKLIDILEVSNLSRDIQLVNKNEIFVTIKEKKKTTPK